MTLKETVNNVLITGIIVKKDFDFVKVPIKDHKGNITGQEDGIGGTLILRSADGSENAVKYFSRKFKKNSNELNGIYKGLVTIKEEYKSLEYYPDNPDVVKIGGSKFSMNDYSKDGEVKSYVEIKANFANRLEQREIETTPLEATFEVSGVIESITEEMYKAEATGNLRVTLNVLGYEGRIIPIVLTVPSSMREGFTNAGFFESGFAKFTGRLINTKEKVETIEKMAFGEDNKKIVTHTIVKKEITGGTPMGGLIENEIDEAEYQQAKAKRKLLLEQIKNKKNDKQQNKPANSPNTFNGTTAINPFARK